MAALAALAIGLLAANVVAIVRVQRSAEFTFAQKVAQTLLVLLVPGFCLLPLLLTKRRADRSDFYTEGADIGDLDDVDTRPPGNDRDP